MMKKYFPVFVFFISFSFLANAQFWSEIHHTGVQEILQNYNNPGPEYGPNLLWGWNGPVDSTVIDNDLDRILKMGFRSVTIEAGYHMRHPYLSEGWFKLIHYAVQEAGKRDMKVWLIDEGKYPSGFAGGKFSSERPDLRMQGLLRGGRIKLSPGESVHRNLHASVVSAVAVNLKSGLAHEVDISGHRLDYTAPDHPVTLLLALHRFKTSVTRAANNPTGGKDTTNSLCDYLNPVATRQFIDFTHTKYFEEMAGEFGKTLLGFRGDEPDYGFIPWTPGITEIFREKKGYDISPWLASFFVKKPTSQMMKAKADYRDVWSQLFADNFFGVLGDWCAEHGVAYMVHLNHEDKLMQLVRSEGSFFRDMRDVQIPGVDAIWNQIWPGTVADFPKLASSAAHLYGKPLAMSESFAAYRTKPAIKTGKWVIDHQLARG
ncbi:MAG TPA: glycosyl hydrolase, partial [Bacteroidales bacterium]|nr:glycosyl hydrolase [Bacteroidales bacterium]